MVLEQDNGTRSRSPADFARPAVQGVGDVAQTAKQDVRTVVEEAGDQAKRVTRTARDRIVEQARDQQNGAVTKIRQMSGQLREMAQGKGGTPAATVVNRVADQGERFADYLADRGPEGVLTELRDVGRRKPMAFLLAAAAAGFVAGRLGKAVLTARNETARNETARTETARNETARSETGPGRSESGPARPTYEPDQTWPSAQPESVVGVASVPPVDPAPWNAPQVTTAPPAMPPSTTPSPAMPPSSTPSPAMPPSPPPSAMPSPAMAPPTRRSDAS